MEELKKKIGHNYARLSRMSIVEVGAVKKSNQDYKSNCMEENKWGGGMGATLAIRHECSSKQKLNLWKPKNQSRLVILQITI
ncbi:hypothetical protein Tco_1063489 [Tanacetum coccineum]